MVIRDAFVGRLAVLVRAHAEPVEAIAGVAIGLPPLTPEPLLDLAGPLPDPRPLKLRKHRQHGRDPTDHHYVSENVQLLLFPITSANFESSSRGLIALPLSQTQTLDCG